MSREPAETKWLKSVAEASEAEERPYQSVLSAEVAEASETEERPYQSVIGISWGCCLFSYRLGSK